MIESLQVGDVIEANCSIRGNSLFMPERVVRTKHFVVVKIASTEKFWACRIDDAIPQAYLITSHDVQHLKITKSVAKKMEILVNDPRK